MSLVIALSVFNGLEQLIRSLYNSFDPEIRITSLQGKTFEITPSFLAKIQNLDGVYILIEVIEDNALLKYQEEQVVVKVKGVSQGFLQEHRIDSTIIEGKPNFYKNNQDAAIIGQGVQYQLSVNLSGGLYAMQLLYPKATSAGSLDPQKLVSRENIIPSGVFSIEKQYDDNYIFVSLEFAQRLFSIGNRRSAIEIKSNGVIRINKLQRNLKELLGENFLVQNSDEQHSSLLKAVKIEKLFMHVTISFIFAIASLNIFFCLTMLAIKKKKDIALLFALGATRNMIKNIFLVEGGLIAFTGSSLGLALGLGICLLQQKFGFVSMGMETSIVDAYPVKLQLADFITTGFTVVVITMLASYRPAIQASKTIVKEHL